MLNPLGVATISPSCGVMKMHSVQINLTPAMLFLRRFFALVMAAGVLIGAFGAHGLQKIIPPEVLPARLETWRTGVLYLLIHALSGFFLTFFVARLRAFFCLILGLLLFSGSLFLRVLTDVTAWGAVAPFGGIAFVIAWVFIAKDVHRS